MARFNTASCLSLGLLLLLSCLLFSPSAMAADDAFLVVHKRASISKVKSAEHVTVSISLHNVGFTEKFTIVSGNSSNSWDKLEGGKTLTHTFTLESKEKGLFYGPPAVVKYRVAAKSTLQEALSTPIPELDLLSEVSPDQKYQWVKALAGKYGPLVSVVSIVGLFTYLLVTPSKSKVSKAKKRR